MFADLVEFRNGVDDVVAHVVRVGSEEAYALKAGNIIDRSKQVSEIVILWQVMSVGVNILSEKRDFFDASPDEHLGLLHNFSDRPADFPATPVWDDAEGAELVAAVNDGNVCRYIGTRNQRADAALGVDVHTLANQVDQRLILLRLHEYIDIRETLLQLIRLGANHATH